MPAYLLLQCDVCGRPFPLLRVEEFEETPGGRPAIARTSPLMVITDEPGEEFDVGPAGVRCPAHPTNAFPA